MFALARHALRIYRWPGVCPARNAIRTVSRAARLPPLTLPPVPSPPPPPPQVTLRDYQEECIESVLSYIQKGHKRLGVSLATGSGKTVIFTHLIDRVPSSTKASQTLILAHRRELVEQAARHCTLTYPEKYVDIEMGSHHASGAADITVASIQSIMSGDRIDKFDPSRFKLILVDEAHHIVSEQYLDVLDHFGLRHAADWTEVNVPALVGVSATFSRFDGKKLGTAIDHIVYHRDYVDMIEDHWLSDVIFTTVETKADLSQVRSGVNGDYQTAALSQAINTDETNDLVVKSWMARAKNRKSTLVFCVDLSHVANLTAKFRQYGFAAQFVTGDTPRKTRAARVDAFRNGEFPVLLNCGVFTEGTDIPNIDCVLLTRPTKSRNLLVQMIGRGMRLHKGKENCHVVDFVASLSTGVVSTPTLFGLDPAEIVENLDSKAMAELKERKEKEAEREVLTSQPVHNSVSRKLPMTVTFTDYDSVHDLIADTAGDQYIRRISEYAWVNAGDNRFVLTTNSGHYLIIEPPEAEGGFVVKYYRKLPPEIKTKSPYATPKVIARGDSFEHVVHAADTFASEIFEHIWISARQPWRRSAASAAQLNTLNKSRPADEQFQLGEVTKGKAADMITRIKHGARGRYEKASTKKRIEDRTRGRDEAVRKRLQGQVRVGPLTEAMTG